MNRTPLNPSFPSFVETLEDRIAPAADLIATIISIEMPDVAVPGDTGTVKFEIKNIASMPTSGNLRANDAVGTTGLHVYLSADTSGDQFTDEIIGKKQNVKFNLAPQKSVTHSVNFTMPALNLDGSSPDAGEYFIVVEADSGGRINESSEGNNDGATAETITYAFNFGDVGTRKGVALKGIDQGDKPFSLNLKGGGLGEVFRDGSDIDISFTGTTDKSAASSDMVGGTFHDISAGSALKSLTFAGAYVTGDVMLSGGIETLFLGNTGGPDSTMSIGGSKAVKTLTLGRVSDLDITAPSGIAALNVIDWNAPDTDTITAPYILALKTLGASKAGIAGDFDASLKLGKTGPNGLGLGKGMITGSLLGGTWDVEGHIQSIAAVSGDGWKLDADGIVGTLAIAGAKSLPGSLTGDKSEAGFTLKANSFGEITITGELNGKIVTTGADGNNRSIGNFLAKSIIGGSVIDASSGTIGKFETGQWLGGGKLSGKAVDSLVTNKKFGSGDFEADLSVTQESFPKPSSIVIAGALRDATWEMRDVGTLKLARLFNSNVDVIGDVDKLLLGNPTDQPAFENSTVNASGITLVNIWNVNESEAGGYTLLRAESVERYVRYAGKSIAYAESDPDEDGIVDAVGNYEFELDND